ncbi:hypothetical protein [Streptomyces sp. NPDC004008]
MSGNTPEPAYVARLEEKLEQLVKLLEDPEKLRTLRAKLRARRDAA